MAKEIYANTEDHVDSLERKLEQMAQRIQTLEFQVRKLEEERQRRIDAQNHRMK